MPEKIIAGFMFAVCVVLLVRVFIGGRRRANFDSAVARLGALLGRRTDALLAAPAARRRARCDAEALIKRARSGGEWDGNVYRPKSFKSRKDRKLR